MAQTQTRVEIETVCSMLESEYRRRALRILSDASGTMTRAELGRAIARDGPRTGTIEPADSRLYHVHLPKLADENAIHYDADAETVAITETGEWLLQCLDAIEREPAVRE